MDADMAGFIWVRPFLTNAVKAMAKQAKKPEPKRLSELAQWMIDAFGKQRLKMMRDEYQAGLPKDMAPHIRQQRIEAINEVFPPLK